ncbi:MAG: nucleotide pyrophosphohydrolase [Gemmataceae bacterium]|nr:nucleotide pyrophosphohydrolase [Gemmataceae bacterium]
MADHEVTIAGLRKRVTDFVTAREWEQFHDPKNLSMALSAEAAELMEHFLWITPEGSRKEMSQDEKRLQVGEEIADITCLVLALCNSIGLDLADIFMAKMAKNEKKYPAEACKGKYHPPGKG